MGKQKRTLTRAQKAEKKRRQRGYVTIFINGRQKCVTREPTVDGMPVDEFIRRNADPIWLLQNGMYEELHAWEPECDVEPTEPEDSGRRATMEHRTPAAPRLEDDSASATDEALPNS